MSHGNPSHLLPAAATRGTKLDTARPTERAAVEKQLQAFLDKFDRRHRALIRAVRQTMRRRLPGAHELVYDNYNFFVIGYGPTKRPSECILSIAAAANGVGLCFLHGASLPDPKKILLGAGKQTRFIRLESAATLQRPEVKSLLRAAVAQSKVPLPAKPRGSLVIRSVSVRQRPRRKEKGGRQGHAIQRPDGARSGPSARTRHRANR